MTWACHPEARFSVPHSSPTPIVFFLVLCEFLQSITKRLEMWILGLEENSISTSKVKITGKFNISVTDPSVHEFLRLSLKNVRIDFCLSM